MVLSKEVLVSLNSTTYAYWVRKGYDIPPYKDRKGRIKSYKRGTKLLVLVSDLPPRSNVKIQVKCDSCSVIRTIGFMKNNTGLCWKCNFERQKGQLHPRFQKEHAYLYGQDRLDDMRLKRQYGIDLDTYNIMLTSQENRCLICKMSQEQEVRKFTVDHCHKSGIVRGLLCNKCNRGLGIFKDSTSLLQSAINYLNRSPSNV